MSERELVMVDEFSKYPDIKALKAVVQALERESAEVLEELRAEIRKRTQEMLADAAEAGVTIGETASPKQRGPKPKSKEEKEAAARKKVAAASEPPTGWSEAETAVELDAE